MIKHSILLFLFLLFIACNKSDETRILGKWQNDRDWFLYKKDLSYASGKDEFKMVDNFKYTINPQKNELNMYTNDKNTSYYLIYEFIGEDTLAIRNTMSSNKTMIKFHRVK